MAEIGPMGMCAYIVFRLALMLGLVPRLLRSGATRARDGKVLCIMAALIAFDFHRDSFINLDVWTAIGMAMVCVRAAAQEAHAAKPPGQPPPSCGLSRQLVEQALCAALALILSLPVTYQASATMIAKPMEVTVQPQIASPFAPDGQDLPPAVSPAGTSSQRFLLFQTYWASRVVAQQLIAHQPGLVRAVTHARGALAPATLAQYINDNVSMIMADKQGLIVVQYRNTDPSLAQRFLSATIAETDHAVAALATARSAQASQLSWLAMQTDLDALTRQNVLRNAAAQELQSGFELAGENSSFDYIERPAAALSTPSPQPLAAMALALILGVLTAAVTAAGRLLLWRTV